MSLNTDSSTSLRVPVRELAGSVPVVIAQKKRVQFRGVSVKLLENLAQYGATGATTHELQRIMKPFFDGISKGSISGCLCNLRDAGKVTGTKTPGSNEMVWRVKEASAKRKYRKRAHQVTPAAKKLAPLPGDPGHVNEVERVVDAAIAQAEHAVTEFQSAIKALRDLGVSLVARAERIEKIKADLADV